VAKKRCSPAATAWRRLLILVFSATSLPAPAAWNITFSDLNPPGASDSCAYAVNGSQQAGYAGIGGLNHAVLWSGAAGFFVDLHPSGTFESIALATSGTQQVGRVTVNVNGEPHAARWAGTAESFEDLHPRVGKSSIAFALDGDRQGGYVVVGSWPSIQDHAAIWSGTADSFIDLHPAGATTSIILAMSDSRQAGMAVTLGYHAAMWSDTAESFLDLHPAGSPLSGIAALSGLQAAGYAGLEGNYHAAFWPNPVASVVDLHPAAATDSRAYAISGSQQAGYATLDWSWHAALWSGSAASFMDLGAALGQGYTNSQALGMWAGADVTYVVGSATEVSSSSRHAILWTLRQVPDLPALELASTELSGETQMVTLAWASAARPCVLECTGSLDGVWTQVFTPWVTNGNRVLATVTNQAPAQFFRLRGN